MGEDVVRTGTVERSDREAFWHHVLADTFAAVQLEGWTRHGMEPAAQLSATRRGRLLFAALEATPHVHRRTPRQIRQADAMYFQAAILTKGAASLEQEGRLAQLGRGELLCTRTRDRSRGRLLTRGR